MYANQQPEEKPRRRRGSIRRFFRTLFVLVLCVALAYVGFRFGPRIYDRLFGGGNTTWISERLSEELKEKNELVVYETTITGRESVSQNAWLLGKVQEIVVPYSFSLTYVVDLSQASVAVNNGTIEIDLPAPAAAYHKLTVDKDNVMKYDWLYPLTTERYATIVAEIEQKLYDECATKPEYLASAWTTAVKDMESLFKSIAEQSELGQTCNIKVREMVTLAPEATNTVTATPAAA